MFKKLFYSTVSILIISLITFTQNVSAANNHYKKQLKNNDINGYVSNFINEIASLDETTTWTSNTKISKIINTYDLNDSINGYIINLKTGSSPSGYIVVELLDKATPDIVEYGYDGTYYATDEKKSKFNENKKIISLNNRGYLYNENNILYDLTSGDEVTEKVENLESEYLQQLELKKLYNETIDNNIVSNSLTTYQVVTESVSVANLWANSSYSSNFTPYTMSSFQYSGDNHCMPTAGMNMLKYWNERRSIPNLYLSSGASGSFASLRYHMYHSDWWGTLGPIGYKGMGNYLSSNNLLLARGSDHKISSNMSWQWIKTQIQNSNAFVFGANLKYYDGRNGFHAFFAVGYQNTTAGQYIRVVDEYDTSLSHFFKYQYFDVTSNITDAWYYRW